MSDTTADIKVITESDKLLAQSVLMLHTAERFLGNLQQRLDAGSRREAVLLNCVQRIKHLYPPINESLEAYRDLFQQMQAEAKKAWELTHAIAEEQRKKVAHEE